MRDGFGYTRAAQAYTKSLHDLVGEKEPPELGTPADLAGQSCVQRESVGASRVVRTWRRVMPRRVVIVLMARFLPSKSQARQLGTVGSDTVHLSFSSPPLHPVPIHREGQTTGSVPIRRGDIMAGLRTSIVVSVTAFLLGTPSYLHHALPSCQRSSDISPKRCRIAVHALDSGLVDVVENPTNAKRCTALDRSVLLFHPVTHASDARVCVHVRRRDGLWDPAVEFGRPPRWEHNVRWRQCL